MDRFSKFARPLGFALGVIGVLMIAVSGYYLYAYMRSGSDADDFNAGRGPARGDTGLVGPGPARTCRVPRRPNSGFERAVP